MRTLKCIGAAQGWGTNENGCKDGPDALDETLQSASLPSFHHILRPDTFVPDKVDFDESFAHVHAFNTALAEEIKSTVEQNLFPLIIGGDHSIAMATWSGVTTALHAEQQFGLIWIDAHMDAHTPETRAKGKWGGMYHAQPVTALHGMGQAEICKYINDTPKLAAEHFSLIGVRSYESGEKENLEKLGVRIFYMDEVNERGFEQCFEEAQSRAKTGTKGYGVSFDLDSIDPDQAPGVGTWEPDGLQADDVIAAMQGLINDSHLKALEIVEYNPHRDAQRQTLDIIERFLNSFLVS